MTMRATRSLKDFILSILSRECNDCEYLQVLERAMFHFENAYKIPVSEVYGYVCKTNLPSNTAFRGFGGPQGMFVSENIIRHIANYLQMDVVKVIFHIAKRNIIGKETTI